MTESHITPCRLRRILRALPGGDTGAGWLLIAATCLAMALANSPLAHGWAALWHTPLGWRPAPALTDLGDWVDEGLMAVFFFTIGLEIKREALAGELAQAATRRLPVLAALAGMAVPALIYLGLCLGFAPGSPLTRGWAIPTTTDIAFAVGVLGLAGRHLPPSLRLFLLSVAVVDDLGAVAIIAFVYTDTLAWGWLAAAAIIWALMAGAARMGLRQGWLFVVLAILLWAFTVLSGVHASLAGVAGALTIPLRPDRQGRSLLPRMEHRLAPWSSYMIIPVFALANAGVPLAGLRLDGSRAVLSLAVAMGLLIGKQAGILGAVLLAERTGIAARPAGASLRQLWGVSAMAGIGFTMSLFLATLAFPDTHGAPFADAAKLGIFAGSLVSALWGWTLLRYQA